MLIDCDFHLHGRYSGGTSDKMSLENISSQGVLKGLDVVGTGDALHPKWLEEIRGLQDVSEGVYEKNGCKFVITVEVEDWRRVHHLIFLPEVSSVEGLRESLRGYSQDLESDGRPHLRLKGEEIVDRVEEAGGFLGPSHAFVPWTSIYKEYDSLAECYGENVDKVGFLELGLSADSEMADLVGELREIAFLSNSDAHSPWPHRLGREFNRLEVKDITFRDIRRSILDKGIVLNVGLDPRLGKYHRTACIKCFTLYKLEDAQRSRWRCRLCGGLLKKGVFDRVKELSSYPSPRHPPHRPRYIRIAPLAEILCLALKVRNVYSDRVQGGWRKLVERFGSEISVLIDVPVEEIREEGGERLARMIKAFRSGRFNIVEGGGGKYGEVVFKDSGPRKFYTGNQSMLDSFVE
jgi:uncharacterized protein (TIGR00375 family)